MLDRIDAGFSLLLHVPGFLTPGSSLSLDNITVHAYLPPRELDHNRQALESPIACIVQIFAQEIALPHVQRARSYRARSGIPPESVEVTRAFQILRERRQELAQQLLPSAPTLPGSPHYHFIGRNPGELEKLLGGNFNRAGTAVADSAVRPMLNLSESRLPTFTSGKYYFLHLSILTKLYLPGLALGTPLHKVKVPQDETSAERAFKNMGSHPASNVKKRNTSAKSKVLKQSDEGIFSSYLFFRLYRAHVAALSDSGDSTEAAAILTSPKTVRFSSRVTSRELLANVHQTSRKHDIHASIGPCTEAIMEDLNVSREYIPRLLNLTQTLGSGQWAAAMQREDFGFGVDKATAMARAMFSDVYGPMFGAPADGAKAQVRSSRRFRVGMSQLTLHCKQATKSESKRLQYCTFVMALTCLILLAALFII